MTKYNPALHEMDERQARADRLRQARKSAGFGGAAAAADHYRWNANTFKAHETGRNGFTAEQGEIYADAFKVSRKWLYLNIGQSTDLHDESSVVNVPVISRVSAGQLMRDDLDVDMLETMAVANLPPGDWIALEVEGDSMDRISPPKSRIIVNRSDKSLVANACYVIGDESGNVTYKRYRPNPMRFEPVSTNPSHEPMFPDNEPKIIGRVKFSLIEM